jgi:hypothetical protein
MQELIKNHPAKILNKVTRETHKQELVTDIIQQKYTLNSCTRETLHDAGSKGKHSLTSNDILKPNLVLNLISRYYSLQLLPLSLICVASYNGLLH